MEHTTLSNPLKNLVEAQIAAQCVQSFNEPACVIIKQLHPCGVALGKSILQAYTKAHQSDPTSAYNGIVAFNRVLDKETTVEVLNNQLVELFLAPEFSEETLLLLKDKPKIQVVTFNEILKTTEPENKILTAKELRRVTERSPSPEQIQDLLFAWTVCKFVKPNGIVYASSGQTLGIGTGPNRFFSARLGVFKAEMEGLSVENAVMASEGLLPLKDSIEIAAKEKIQAIIQPGGSSKDAEIIEAANKHHIAMVFTNIQYFRSKE